MADDGTKIYEPLTETTAQISTVDTEEITYGPGDLRDRQRFLLAGGDVDTDVVVTGSSPEDDALGLVIRLAGRPHSGSEPDNQPTAPLGADEVYTGVWKEVQDHGSVLALYAIQPTSEAPASVQIQWSDDESTVIATTTMAGKEVTNAGLTYAVYLSILNGSYQGRYARLKVTNGPVAQTQNPIAFFARNQYPFGGSFGSLDSPLTFFSQGLLTRAVQSGLTPDGTFVNIPLGGHDPDNHRANEPFDADEEFTGEFKSAAGLNSMLVFAFTDAPLTTAQIQWSNDGITPSTGLLSSSDLIGTVQTFEFGPLTLYIYLTVVTTVIDKFYRLHLVNGATPGTTYGEADIWVYDKPFTGSFGSLTANLSNISTALLTRAVQAGVTPDGAFKNTRSQGRHAGNSTIVPLPGNTGGTDHIFRGEWFEWSDAFGGMVVDVFADAPGTLNIDFSESDMPDSLTDDDVGLSQSINISANVLFRRSFNTQSRWVRLRYVNGATAQSDFGLSATFMPGFVLPTAPVGEAPTSGAGMAVVTKAFAMMKKSEALTEYAHQTATLVGTKRSADVNVTNLEEGIEIKATTAFVTGQGEVTDQAALPYPPLPSAGRKAVSFTNMSPRVPMFFSESTDKLTAQGDVLLPLASKTLDLGPEQNVYWKIEDQGVTATTSDVNAATTQNNVGVLNPNNARVSDNTRATLDALADSFELTGFVGARAQDVVASVLLSLEGRRAAAPATETVGYVDTVSGTGGNVGTVVSAAVALNADYEYLVEISRRNTAAAVSSVVGMGTTWTEVLDVSGAGAVVRTSLWRPVSPPTAGGTITASFSALPTASVITVSRFSGVDLTTPFTNQETLPSGGSTASYSDAIDGAAGGMVVTFASMRERTHTAGSGFTEQAEVRTGLTNNDASTAISTLPLTVTGSQAYSGTLSGNVGWAVIAVALQPRAAVNPVVRVRYKVGTEPFGTTILTAALTNTADTIYTADITTDRDWTFEDIDAITLFVDVLAISAAAAEVDRAGIIETDAEEGSSARLAWSEVAGGLA
jgi:hypothetical protein